MARTSARAPGALVSSCLRDSTTYASLQLDMPVTSCHRDAALTDRVVIMGGPNQLIVHLLPTAGSDAEELAELMTQLHAELLDLDLPSVSSVPVPAPDHSKGLGSVIDQLVIQFGTLNGLRSAVSTIRGWISRTRRSIEISIDGDVLKLTSATAQQQEKIIEAWLAKHTTGA
jgi:hypothetical protein